MPCCSARSPARCDGFVVVPGSAEFSFELSESRHECLRCEAATVLAEAPEIHGFGTGWLEVHGDGHRIEDNLIGTALNYGLHFKASSSDNVYRGNIARGNSGTGCTGTASGDDFCDEGTNNTSGGGNFMPDEM